MLKTGDSTTPTTPDGFAARLRQVLDSYGSTSSLARSIERSEGAVRKWLRGQSEPNVTDLRAICEETATSVEWLVMGRGERRRILEGESSAGPGSGGPGGAGSVGAGSGSGLTVGEAQTPYGTRVELPPLNYELMDDVVNSLRDENPALLGDHVPARKQSSVLTTVYNMSRRTRHVDREEVARLVGLMA